MMTTFLDKRALSTTGIEPVRSVKLRSEFEGLSVLLTGHTGFKGSWLALWLRELGAKVTGFSLDPPTKPSNYLASDVGSILQFDYRADIRDRATLEDAIRSSHPDVIFHLAAQSVVLDGYAQPLETFSVNALGTATLLDTLRTVGQACAVVVVTSDKCYANDESGRAFEEGDPLGGRDPYSASKAGAELVTAAYREAYFAPGELDRHGVAIATARAGNVIGGGDWTAHGVVADIMRAVEAGVPVQLRRPTAIRPWQHVLEPLDGYLTLAAHLRSADGAAFCSAWNFGPEAKDEATVGELTELLLSARGKGTWEGSSRLNDLPEAGVLRLSIRRAQTELDWQPRWSLMEAVERTANWYSRFEVAPGSARHACVSDITDYMAADPGAAGKYL